LKIKRRAESTISNCNDEIFPAINPGTIPAQGLLVSQNPSSKQRVSDTMKKILVVDNHPLMLKFMTNLLEKNGHQVPAS
jgi:hypothetical protein